MAKKRINFPSDEKLKAIRAELERGPASFVLPHDAGIVERTKYEFCRQIIRHMRDEKITQRELAERIGIPETRVSEIVHYRIEKFTIDRLLLHLEKLKPNLIVRLGSFR